LYIVKKKILKERKKKTPWASKVLSGDQLHFIHKKFPHQDEIDLFRDKKKDRKGQTNKQNKTDQAPAIRETPL